MTEPETDRPIPEHEDVSLSVSNESGILETDGDLPPEPWTPQRVSEWNAYYDVYVKLAALLLVFMVACNYIADPQLWLHLKAGQLIAEQRGPIRTDVFSYTEYGRAWINVNWLFQWVNAAIYKLVNEFVPVNAAAPNANRANAEQIAVGSLVVVNASLRLATAWLLLMIRHRGPGPWWSAAVVTLALGGVLHPLYGLTMGGIAGVASVSPHTWGILLLAFEMLILFWAVVQGHARTLCLLIPAFVLWANVDPSFLTGLLVLAAAGVGCWLDRRGRAGRTAPVAEADGQAALGGGEIAAEITPPRPAFLFIVLGFCAAGCLVNPFTYRVYADALFPYLHLFQPTTKVTTVELLSFFGRWVRDNTGRYWYLLPAFYGGVVLVGLASFLLNFRRFSWARFLPFALISVIWALLMYANSMFAVVFAAVVGPNGQEWYHDRFGTEGRLGRLWTVWSTGGRLVTLALVFLMVGLDITGWKNTLREVQFGLGYNPDAFTFEAAEFLADNTDIQGNIFNTSMAQGDTLIWKGSPRRRSYVDSRTRFFPPELLSQWEETRNALKGDDVEKWKPLLDKYKISAIMIEVGPQQSPTTYQHLMRSPHWLPFYDDGRIIMFGRADAPASDLAFFKANRLDPDLRAYRVASPVPGSERPPNPTSMIDSIFQTRALNRLHSRTESARRWLDANGLDTSAAKPGQAAPIPDPARCLLAIREARIALAKSPDDWLAYRMLAESYRYLMMQEGAMMAGIAITPQNADRIRLLTPHLENLMTRFQQRATALNFAIQTTPPPDSADARHHLHALNLELFRLYMSGNALDLSRDRLQIVLESSQPGDLAPEVRINLKKQLDDLDQQMKTVEDSLIELETERQVGPIDQASFALSRGAAGRAISLLADAERSNLSPAAVKPRLVDLYCNTGQPEKAMELLTAAIDDSNLGSEPGSGASRQGRVYFLLGDYRSAASLWKDRAIPRVRLDRSGRALDGARALLRGEAIRSTDDFLKIPGAFAKQSSWEFDLAMCELEAGVPASASEHFTNALTWAPDLTVRPIAAYYLERIGKPAPELTKSKVTVPQSGPPPATR